VVLLPIPVKRPGVRPRPVQSRLVLREWSWIARIVAGVPKSGLNFERFQYLSYCIRSSNVSLLKISGQSTLTVAVVTTLTILKRIAMMLDTTPYVAGDCYNAVY
jgi:hypothetical protein